MMFARSRLLLAGLGFIGLNACSDAPPEGQYVGYVEADWVYIAAPSGGWIETLPVREGAQVIEGDLLFSLDNERERASFELAESRIDEAEARARDLATGARQPEIEALEAQLSDAQARLRQAKLEYDRIMPLVQEGIETQLRGDRVTADLRAAEAQASNAREQISIARQAARPADRAAARANIDAARADSSAARYALGERSVEAPRAGTVSEIFHEPGEYVGGGATVLALLPQDGLKVRFFVSQEALPSFEIGNSVQVSADGLAEPVAARISYIAEEAEFTPPVIYSRSSRGKLVFLIEATLPLSSTLKPGLPVDVLKP